MKLCEAVKLLKLENQVIGETVYCEFCRLAIAECAKKTVSGKFVRHAEPCHRNWRKQFNATTLARRGVTHYPQV